MPTPDVSFVRQFDVPFANGHYYSFGISLELPLLNSFAGQRQRAAAALSAADAEQQRMTAIVRRDVASAYATVQAQERVLQQFSAPMLETVAQNIDAARYAYERGATSLLDVLDAVRALQDFRALRMSAIHDYRLARFTLDAAAGAT